MDRVEAGIANLRHFLEDLFWEINHIPGLTDEQKDLVAEIEMRLDDEAEKTFAVICPATDA